MDEEKVYAISLLQPWATLVILGAKKWETRGWKIPGAPPPHELYIHASFKPPDNFFELMETEHFVKLKNFFIKDGRIICPVGQIIGRVKVTGFVPTEKWIFDRKDPSTRQLRTDVSMEHAFGDYNPGLWAWKLESPIRLPEPVDAKGSLGRWIVPPDVLVKVKKQEVNLSLM